jgi:hypothetical protein
MVILFDATRRARSSCAAVVNFGVRDVAEQQVHLVRRLLLRLIPTLSGLLILS